MHTYHVPNIMFGNGFTNIDPTLFELLNVYLWFVITIVFIADGFLFVCLLFFNNKLLKLHNIRMQIQLAADWFKIRLIEVSKQQLCISTSLCDYNKTYSKEIHPGAPTFSRVKGFRVVPGKHRCLCSSPPKNSFQPMNSF